MSSFGVRIRGSSRQLILDQQNGVLHVVRRGTFNIDSGATGGRMYVGFSSAIQTQEKPHVFAQIRPFAGPSGAVLLAYDVRMEGGPGNWTGFSFAALGNVNGTTSWRYVASLSNPPASSARFGMRLRRQSDNQVLFDTGYPCMRYLFATRAWNVSNRREGVTRYWAWDTAVAYSVRADAYVMLNTIVTPTDGIAGFDSVYVPALYVYQNRARFTMQITGENGSNPNYIQPVIYAMPTDEW